MPFVRRIMKTGRPLRRVGRTVSLAVALFQTKSDPAAAARVAAARVRLANVLLRHARALAGIADESLALQLAPGHGREDSRWTYQQQWVPFDIRPGERVLDIGSGNDPFPYATHLADMYGENNRHRGGDGIALVRDKRPLVYADVERLPFRTGSFEFVYCSHMLEHVADPVAACREIVRVGRRGYIETPTRLSDVMFNFTRLRHHRWHVASVADTMIFVEYSEREYRDTGTNTFYAQFHSDWANPFQALVHKNRDLFVNMMRWVGGVRVVVVDREGRVLANETIGTPGQCPDTP